MNKRTQRLINELNNILSNTNQKLRISIIIGDYVLLSNGYEIITRAEKLKLWKRLKKSNIKEYLNNFDILYGLDTDKSKKLEKEIRFKISSKGGKIAQIKHGNKIKKNLSEKGDIPWNKGLSGYMDGWCKGLTKETDERLMKLSKDRMGSGNPMYGVCYTKDYKDKKSKLMKQKILDGSFTPNIHNSQTHFPTIVGNKKFRSSWEAAFYTINPDYEYEKIRIPYIYNDKEKIYIVDFVNFDTKKLIEIKPKCHRDTKKMKAKCKSALKWCEQKGYEFNILDENYFIKNWDKIKFDKLDLHSKNNLNKLKMRLER